VPHINPVNLERRKRRSSVPVRFALRLQVNGCDGYIAVNSTLMKVTTIKIVFNFNEPGQSFNRDTQRPSSVKEWQMPPAAAFPSRPPRFSLRLPLDARETSYSAAPASIFNFF
jgi:hypothetical protein